ncbi:sigma-E processing peptidase SpoIIGA [Butyricicoccus sp.]|uniref:sigma-E processing peptidase SpoIIGA n=1 Tax=Butyricicoccus sp. TaxID=2049021 RepID=UPI003736ED91
MRVIYLDVLLVLNFCMDYCILRAASAIGGRPCPMWRLSLASGFGAAYAAGSVLVPALAALPVRLLSCAAMAGIAFSARGARRLLRQTLLVMLVAFVFGGCVTALEQVSGTVLSAGGALYAPVSRKALLVSAALAYGLSGIVFRNQARENRPHGETIRLSCGGKVQEVYLLVDSGNTLRDPVTGRPVFVLTRAAALRVLPEEVQFLPLLLGKDNAADLVQRAQQEGAGGWRLVSFRSIGGGGLMPCFRPDAVTREDGSAYDSLAAISGAGTICAGEYDGLIEP